GAFVAVQGDSPSQVAAAAAQLKVELSRQSSFFTGATNVSRPSPTLYGATLDSLHEIDQTLHVLRSIDDSSRGGSANAVLERAVGEQLTEAVAVGFAENLISGGNYRSPWTDFLPFVASNPRERFSPTVRFVKVRLRETATEVIPYRLAAERLRATVDRVRILFPGVRIEAGGLGPAAVENWEKTRKSAVVVGFSLCVTALTAAVVFPRRRKTFVVLAVISGLSGATAGLLADALSPGAVYGLLLLPMFAVTLEIVFGGGAEKAFDRGDAFRLLFHRRQIVNPWPAAVVAAAAACLTILVVWVPPDVRRLDPLFVAAPASPSEGDEAEKIHRKALGCSSTPFVVVA
ncbi:MAG: hypothetical protein ACRDD1_08145, partial [Planctomycetia bacterium]